jgi:hypothetical protein
MKIKLLILVALLIPILRWIILLLGTSEFPAFVNPYDPELGGINCNSDCSRLANGYEWQEADYGQLAACPPRFMGCSVTFTNDHAMVGPLLCSDTGSALLFPQYVEKLDKTVEFFDVLWDLTEEDGTMIPREELPWWNHAVFEEWEADCTYANN